MTLATPTSNDEELNGWENAALIDEDAVDADTDVDEHFDASARPMGSDLSDYFARVGRIRPMTLVEEQRCVEAKQLYADWRQAKAQGTVLDCDSRALAASHQAFDRLWEAHLSFVISLAKQYRYREMPVLDLVQEGSIGLARAIEKFDPTRGVRFTTYAKYWIRQAIHRALSDKLRLVRLPVKRTDELQRYKQTIRALTYQLEREPTRAEIATALGCQVKRVEMLESLLVTPISLDTPVGDDEDLYLGDSLADDAPTPAEAHESQTNGELINQVLRRFPPIERKLIRLRFGLDGEEPRARGEVATILGWSLDEVKTREAELLEALAEDSRLTDIAFS